MHTIGTTVMLLASFCFSLKETFQALVLGLSLFFNISTDDDIWVQILCDTCNSNVCVINFLYQVSLLDSSFD